LPASTCGYRTGKCQLHKSAASDDKRRRFGSDSYSNEESPASPGSPAIP
jgi:hypothetical protein